MSSTISQSTYFVNMFLSVTVHSVLKIYVSE